ncbi:hypothetical protein HMPREF3191_01390, partial [Veillonellaceae bacterium DNF00626]
YIKTKVDTNGLTLSMDETKLNSQINDQITNNITVKGKMDSWKLKATGDTAEQEIKDGNTVTFDVAEAGKGLTVSRKGSTIKYGINASQLASNITNNVVTNINGGDAPITNISAKFSISGKEATTKKEITLSKTATPNIQFLGEEGKTTVTVGGDATAPTVTVGLDKTFTDSVANNTTNIATNTSTINNITKKLTAGFNLKDAGTGTGSVSLGGEKAPTVTFAGGANITSKVDGTTVTYGLNNALTNMNSITFAAPTATSKALTIDGKTGTITGLTNTTWNAEIPDDLDLSQAATQGQLKELQQSIKTTSEQLSGKSDFALERGTYKVNNGNVTLKVKNGNAKGDSSYDVTIQDVASAQATTDALNTKANKDATNIDSSVWLTKLGLTDAMHGFNVKAGTGDEQAIKNGETVTFDVAESGKGLSVSRVGSTIKYGIDGSKIDLTSNTAITNINNTLKEDKATVVAGDYVTVKTTADTEKGNTFTVKGPTITGEGSVSVSDIEEGGKKVGYKITGKNTTLKTGITGLSVADGKLKLNVADTDNHTVTGEVDLKTLDLSGNTTVNNLDTKIENITKTGGLLDNKADKDAGNIGEAERTAWAGKLGT